VLEKDKNSVLRGLVRVSLAQGVLAPTYLKADARAVMRDVFEEACSARDVKLPFTYAMHDPKIV